MVQGKLTTVYEEAWHIPLIMVDPTHRFTGDSLAIGRRAVWPTCSVTARCSKENWRHRAAVVDNGGRFALLSSGELWMAKRTGACERCNPNLSQIFGWSNNGPNAEETGPAGTCVTIQGKMACDPNCADGSGSKVVRYLVPPMNRTVLAQSVRATLYSQTIPSRLSIPARRRGHCTACR